MTTMKEIAQQAGVSISTVSLVLNNHDAGRVKASIAQTVRDTAQKMGYRPNPIARSLRTNKTRILAFLSEEIATTPYAGGIILGAQDAASTLGYMMFTVNADGQVDQESEIATLKRYGVDGFMVAKMSNRYTDVPASLDNYPVVLVDASDHDKRFPSIEPDEFHIAYDATNRLITANCERIAYVGCSEPLLAQSGRLAGYRQALEDAGRSFDDHLVVNVLNNDPALAAVSDMFDRAHPDGVFCFNDSRAWYVYECAARRDLQIGKDVSVVGVDNHRVFAETLVPRLTTVELPHYEMGYWATAKLVSLIEQRPLDDLQLPHTTAPLPPLDSPAPAKIHCTLIEKDSVRS